MATSRQKTGFKTTTESRFADVGPDELEAVRLVLRGGSVVDWHRLGMRDEEDVNRFLRVNELEPTHEGDMQRLEELRADSVDYLRNNFRFRIADEVAVDAPARTLFLMASHAGPHQQHSCMVLKIMHIIHHLAGRQLAFRLPVSDDVVFSLVERKVVRVVEEMRAAGVPIIEFDWSRKTASSLITKLLAKRSTLAANVYDKLRFRLMVRDRDDLLPLLLELNHRLIPFNYVVPGESVNDIVSLRDAILQSENLTRVAKSLSDDHEIQNGSHGDQHIPINEFSGADYRIINFVADVPIRIDETLCRVDDPQYQEFGPIVFVLTEFQVADEATARENDQGDSNHARYKARQVARVKDRLAHGLPAQERQPAEGSAPPTAAKPKKKSKKKKRAGTD